MTVEVDLNGRRRQVSLQPRDGGWEVVVDGRPFSAAAARAGGYLSLLVGARSYEVSVEPGPDGKSLVRIDGVPVVLSVVDPRRSRSRTAGAAGSAAAGSTRVTAPMPGRVVRLLVRPGDVVSARQGVAVVEAMKMENELRAPRAGTVAEVRVAEGASVEANAVLVVLE
jgi:biotin carboxyl carrier protein